MPTILDPKEFLDQSANLAIIDVRSPDEYQKGHIPSAHCLPLFDNEERAEIGTLYKKQGKEVAMSRGLEIALPKKDDFMKVVTSISPDKQIAVHCWRGGMRSGKVAEFLEQEGYEVILLQRGYKAYRNYVLDLFRNTYKLNVLGGMTGSGKTEILYEMAKLGEQVVDLEGLANHKGSAFGHLGEEPQPRPEQFENAVAKAWREMDFNKPIWVEDESFRIGNVNIPYDLYLRMRETTVFEIDMPQELRIQRLIKDYGHFTQEQITDSVNRIAKRLGGQNVQSALESLKDGDLETGTRIALTYYDKAYKFGLSKREDQTIIQIETDTLDASENAKKVIERSQQQNNGN